IAAVSRAARLPPRLWSRTLRLLRARSLHGCTPGTDRDALRACSAVSLHLALPCSTAIACTRGQQLPRAAARRMLPAAGGGGRDSRESTRADARRDEHQ